MSRMTDRRAALDTLPIRHLRHLPVLILAATLHLAAIACGPGVPDKAEAAAALSKAIASTLTRTLPASTYCMTANPDFTFRTMSQIDFIETFQNLKDKDPLRDAARAGCHIHLDEIVERADAFAATPRLVLMHVSQLYQPDEVAPILDARLPPELRARTQAFVPPGPWPG